MFSVFFMSKVYVMTLGRSHAKKVVPRLQVDRIFIRDHAIC